MSKRSGYILIAVVYVIGVTIATVIWGGNGALLITLMLVVAATVSGLYGKRRRRWDQDSERKYGGFGEVRDGPPPGENSLDGGSISDDDQEEQPHQPE